MKSHELKVWPTQFAALLAGTKTHEWRRNDRHFAGGDELILEEYDPAGDDMERYTGRKLWAIVTWLTEGFGVPAGWCCMSVRIEREKTGDKAP